MGLLFSALDDLFESFAMEESARILMVGLDSAGKTTILNKIKLNEQVHTVPTIGFNVETVEPVKGIEFTVWDLGGQANIIDLWHHYFQNTDGLVFVVDSCDRTRIVEAKEALHSALNDVELRDVPIVVIANKQDLPNSMNPAELINKLGLRNLHNKWHVQGTCAVNGDGIYESMDILAKMIQENRHRYH